MSAHAAPSPSQLCQRSDWLATTGDPDQDAPVACSRWPTAASPVTAGTAVATGEVSSQSLRMSPRSRIARSAVPSPHTTFSMLPSRELIVSSSGPPLKESTAAPPVSVSFPSRPMSVSGPLPVVRVSFPRFMFAATGIVTDGSTISESFSFAEPTLSVPVTADTGQLKVLVGTSKVHVAVGAVLFRPAGPVSRTRRLPPTTVAVSALAPSVGPWYWTLPALKLIEFTIADADAGTARLSPRTASATSRRRGIWPSCNGPHLHYAPPSARPTRPGPTSPR